MDIAPMDLIAHEDRDWHWSNNYLDKYMISNFEKSKKGNYRKI